MCVKKGTVKRVPQVQDTFVVIICMPDNYYSLKLARLATKVVSKQILFPLKQVVPTPEQLDSARGVKCRCFIQQKEQGGILCRVHFAKETEYRALTKLTASQVSTLLIIVL